MRIVVPYQLIDLPVLTLCLQGIRQFLSATERIDIVGPPLPSKLSREITRWNTRWIDEQDAYADGPRESMPQLVFRGRDVSQRLYTQLQSWLLAAHTTDPVCIVVRPNLVFVNRVILSADSNTILPTQGPPNPGVRAAASRLLGSTFSHGACSQYFMAFDVPIVKEMLALIGERFPRKSLPAAVAACIDMAQPAFLANDVYGGFALKVAPAKVRIMPMRTQVLPRDVTDRHPHSASVAGGQQCAAIFYEPGWLQETDWFLAEAGKYVDLKSVKVMLDVGSRDAEVALSAKRQLTNAHIYSFECNPDAIQLCRSNLRGESEISLVENAVSNVSGPVSFFAIDPMASVTPHLDGNIGASSLFQADPAYPYEKYAQKEITVQAITLESWAQGAGIDAVDLIWIDLQGAELAAFQGLGPLLRTVKVIYTEVEYRQMYKGQPTHQQLAAFMQANGFRLCQRLNTSEWFGNELYVRNDLVSAAP